jgi:hypothetical protein
MKSITMLRDRVVAMRAAAPQPLNPRISAHAANVHDHGIRPEAEAAAAPRRIDGETVLKTLAVVLLAAAGYGCNTPSHDVSATQLGNHGLVIVSCSQATVGGVKPRSKEKIQFHYIGDKETWRKNYPSAQGQLYTVPTFDLGNGDFGPDTYGTVYALSLKPGRYMFDGWWTSDQRGGLKYSTLRHWTNMSPTNFFNVLPGATTYIGNLHHTKQSNGEGQVQLKDMRDRDLPVFLKKYPAVKSEDVRITIME